MNRIEEMIRKLCPKGVEYKQLGDIGDFYGGLTGKGKDDFKDGNAKFVSYMNVYSNPALDLNIGTFVRVAENEKQNKIQYCDILFTGSSETPDECGMSSVVTEHIEEDLYLNSFCFGYRLNEPSLYNPHFLKHLFRSFELRQQIALTASGVTRFNVSKKRFAKISIPVPPIEIQNEVVNILDKFTELEAELEARRKQYEYYRNKLLNFSKFGGGNSENVKWCKLGDIGVFIRGNGLQKKDFTEQGVGCIHYGQIYTCYHIFTDKTKSYISPELAKKLKKAKYGDIVIAATSENVEDVCKAVAWLGEDDIAISWDAYIFRHSQNPKYIAYFFSSESFQDQKKPFVTGTKVMRVSDRAMSKILIPIPPKEEQQRIVAILDKFEKLVNDISEGLPAEIAARRQQYEYYRDKLLCFD